MWKSCPFHVAELKGHTSWGSSIPHRDNWHPWLFTRHEFSNIHVGKAVNVGEQCCGPKFQLTMTLCQVLLPWRAPHWHQLVQKDKGINPGWSTSVLKGFRRPQILICLAILPQLVHREEMFRWFGINSNQCDTIKIKYAIFPKPDQKSLEVCGKNSSGFPKAESGSIIHESCFHDIGKKRPLFSILHRLTWIYTSSVLEALMRWFQQKSVYIKSPL